MSAEPVKKRGRPKKVVSTVEEVSKTSQNRGKLVKEAAKKQKPNGIEASDSKSRPANIEKVEIEPSLGLKDTTTPATNGTVQDMSSPIPPAYQNSKILRELSQRTVSNPIGTTMPPLTTQFTSPTQLSSSPPLKITSSPILQQEAALSTTAKPTSTAKPTITASKASGSPKRPPSRKVAPATSAKAVGSTTTTSSAAKNLKSSTSTSKPTAPINAKISTASPSSFTKYASSTTSASSSKPIPPTTKIPTPAAITASSLPKSTGPLPSHPEPAQSRPPPPSKPVDRSDPRYRAALRRWTTILVGLPIVIVTSWHLYERLVLGKEEGTSLFKGVEVGGLRRVLDRIRESTLGAVASKNGETAAAVVSMGGTAEKGDKSK